MGDYYVYEHLRADTGAPFYVGKGKGARCKSTQGRNTYWRNVVRKCGPPVIRQVVAGLDEELAHLVEMELIAKHRALGTRLTNMTDGGEGMSGYLWTKEAALQRASALRGLKRPDISARLTGVPKSDAHRKNLSIARLGKPISQAAREAIERRPTKPRRHVQTKMFPRFGHKDSEATRAKKSAARKGELNPRFGVQISEDQKARQIAALMARPRLSCPHCGRCMDEANAKRWHFDNCGERK